MDPAIDIEARLKSHRDEYGLGGWRCCFFEATEHVVDAFAFAASVSLNFDLHAQEEGQRDCQTQRDGGVREQCKVWD